MGHVFVCSGESSKITLQFQVNCFRMQQKKVKEDMVSRGRWEAADGYQRGQTMN